LIPHNNTKSGGSEAKYGRFLGPIYRDHNFLMTKTRARDFSAAQRDLEESLRCLRTDHLDLWQMHSVESSEDVDRRRRDGVSRSRKKRRKAAKRVPSDLLDTARQPLTGYSWEKPINLRHGKCQSTPLTPSYKSLIKNVLPLLTAKNLGVLATKTLADRGFFARNRWGSR